MKRINYLLLIAVSLVTIVACKNKETQDDSSKMNDSYFNYLHSKMDTISSIDTRMDTSNCAQYSLDFGNEKNERYFATMYCDTKGDVHLMEELLTNRERLMTKNKFYYADGGRLYATLSERQENKDTVLSFIEELNLYGENGKIERSFKRITAGDIEGDYLPSDDNAVLKNDRLMEAMKNEGEFALTFQGIIKTDNLDYLIVGASGTNNFTSAMQIEANTPFIKDIYVNEIRYVGRKIGVNFERKIMGNFSYQVFIAGKWLD
jgi:hypothetical protein